VVKRSSAIASSFAPAAAGLMPLSVMVFLQNPRRRAKGPTFETHPAVVGAF
jgi:hypothetical protein